MNNLMLLYQIAEKVAKLEKDKDFYNQELVYIMLQLVDQTIDWNIKDIDIARIEVPEYFPIATNPDLNNKQTNVLFLETEQKTLKRS